MPLGHLWASGRHDTVAEAMAAVADFLEFLVPIYTITLALYFLLGVSFDWLNKRNPGRRIQKNRSSEKRRDWEVRQSFASILVTSTSISLALTAQQAGWALQPWPLHWWAALPLFLLCMFLYDTWFYFGHRLMHTRWLFRFHAPHHRTLAPTVWTNDAIGCVETSISQGFYVVAVFLVPFPPVILLAHRLFDHFNGTIGHAGYEYFATPGARYPSPLLCTTFHDQHHEEFRYNFANYFSFWDRLMGTIAPTYDRRVKNVEDNAAPLSLSRAEPEADPAGASVVVGPVRGR